MPSMKRTKMICTKCGGKDFLIVQSSCRDCSFWQFPNGEQGDGYLPSIPFVSPRGEDISLKLCVDCGTPFQFDSNKLKMAIANASDEKNEESEDSPQMPVKKIKK